MAPPTLYFTVAPNDVDNLLTLTLCRPDDADLQRLSTADRYSTITSNSPAAALVFQRQMRAMFTPVRVLLPSYLFQPPKKFYYPSLLNFCIRNHDS